MFSDTNSVMYFGMIYCLVIAVTFIILTAINRNATLLRKSWNIYISMYILQGVFFMGLFICLPSTMPSISREYNYNAEIDQVEMPSETKSILREQRREINDLKDSTATFNKILWVAFFTLAMFFPMIHYNLIKSNLEIERLSGKRMGSLD